MKRKVKTEKIKKENAKNESKMISKIKKNGRKHRKTHDWFGIATVMVIDTIKLSQ